MVHVKTYSGRSDASAVVATNWTTREVKFMFNVYFILS